MDWREIDATQKMIRKLRDQPQVSLSAIEHDAGLYRGWCRNFIAGNPVTMRPKEHEVKALMASAITAKKAVAAITVPKVTWTGLQ